VRVVRDGEVLPRSWFTRTARTGSTRVDDLVDPARVLDLHADGATVVLQSLHRWWPPLAAFCRELELVLSHPLQANAYLTPPGAAGLAPHHDTHDVFVLQVHGTKHWTIRRPVIDSPLPRQQSDHDEAAAQPVLLEAELQPGDSLYLPRGYVHSASAQEGTSLHLTLGVLATTVHDLLRQVLDLAAADDVALRRALPAGYAADPELAAGAVKGALADLDRWLDAFDPTSLAEELGRRFLDGRRPLLGGQLLALSELAAIGDDTPLRPTQVPHRLEAAGDRLQIVMGDRRLTLPAAVEPAVRRLLDGSARHAADLADRLDAGSRLVLVRRLVREGLLRQAEPDG
jgi:lysine-specific demethylase/histidyl-hydroxylase NO66